MNDIQSRLKQANPDIHIYSINDPEFLLYGNILNSEDFSIYYDYLKDSTDIPEHDNMYVAHDQKIKEVCKGIDTINDTFGYIDVEFGYVNGNNSKLNALEYHKSSEINVALTPLVLILALHSDLIDNQLDINKVKIFLLPERTTIELHPKTLHFSPCKVSDEGFKCGVILPMGTNMDFVKAKNQDYKENKLLFKTNKWLLAHPEHQKMISLGAYIGLNGKNIEIKY
jgi:hypothetical protein